MGAHFYSPFLFVGVALLAVWIAAPDVELGADTAGRGGAAGEPPPSFAECRHVAGASWDRERVLEHPSHFTVFRGGGRVTVTRSDGVLIGMGRLQGATLHAAAGALDEMAPLLEAHARMVQAPPAQSGRYRQASTGRAYDVVVTRPSASTLLLEATHRDTGAGTAAGIRRLVTLDAYGRLSQSDDMASLTFFAHNAGKPISIWATSRTACLYQRTGFTPDLPATLETQQLDLQPDLLPDEMEPQALEPASLRVDATSVTAHLAGNSMTVLGSPLATHTSARVTADGASAVLAVRWAGRTAAFRSARALDAGAEPEVRKITLQRPLFRSGVAVADAALHIDGSAGLVRAADGAYSVRARAALDAAVTMTRTAADGAELRMSVSVQGPCMDSHHALTEQQGEGGARCAETQLASEQSRTAARLQCAVCAGGSCAACPRDGEESESALGRQNTQAEWDAASACQV